MAGSVNKVILVGNLGADPEIRTTQQGSKIANLSIATSESWKDRNTGERKENTQWHRVVIFTEPLANLCEQYLKKGSKVYIEGQLETRKWQDNNGQDKYSTEVVIRPFKGELTFLDGRNDNSGGGYQNSNNNNSNQNYGGGQQQQQASAGNAAPAPMDDFEDEIPF